MRSSRAPIAAPDGATFIPFTAQTRMSGIDLPDGDKIRKGAPDAIVRYVESVDGVVPRELGGIVGRVGARGATPLVVAENARVVGVIALEDILKPGIKERMAQLRLMGLRTVMITGDNPLDCASDRQGGGRRRLHRRGDAGKEAASICARSRRKASSWR